MINEQSQSTKCFDTTSQKHTTLKYNTVQERNAINSLIITTDDDIPVSLNTNCGNLL